MELRRILVISHDHDLHMRTRVVNCGDPVTGRKNSVLARNSREERQSLPGFLAVVRIIGIAVQAKQHDCSHGISCWSGGILERFTHCAKYPQAFAIPSCGFLRIEEPTRARVEKAIEHYGGNIPGEIEITQIGRSLVCVEARNCRGCVIVKHSADLTPLRTRVGIGNHMA